MKQIEWFGNQSFQSFLDNCKDEKLQRSRLKVLERRAIDEQRNRIRSASLTENPVSGVYSMCENEKIRIIHGLIDTFNSSASSTLA